jgi:ankyrin repeat protein
LDIHEAAAQGDEATVKRLLAAGIDVNARDAEYFAPLMHAASNAHANVVRILLSADADIDAT